MLDNYGTVDSATVDGSFVNYSGTVNTATVNGSFANKGTVNTATVSGSGEFDNSGTVNTATVSGSGTFNNGSTVDSATVNGGTFVSNGGTVGTATVNGGEFASYGSTIIDNVIQYGGRFINDGSYADGGIVFNAELYGGSYEGNGYTDNLFVGSGGSLDSGLYTGTIGNLTVDDGSLWLTPSAANNETYDKLNIAGMVTLSDVSLYLRYEPETAISALAFGVSLLATSAVTQTFDANFSIDLASFFNFIGDNAGFAANDWWTGIASVNLAQGDGFVELYSQGGSVFGLQKESSTPEPATLLIIGLGLVGLGLSARRRRLF
jgi:hypothetical protein